MSDRIEQLKARLEQQREQASFDPSAGERAADLQASLNQEHKTARDQARAGSPEEGTTPPLAPRESSRHMQETGEQADLVPVDDEPEAPEATEVAPLIIDPRDGIDPATNEPLEAPEPEAEEEPEPASEPLPEYLREIEQQAIEERVWTQKRIDRDARTLMPLTVDETDALIAQVEKDDPVRARQLQQARTAYLRGHVARSLIHFYEMNQDLIPHENEVTKFLVDGVYKGRWLREAGPGSSLASQAATFRAIADEFRRTHPPSKPAVKAKAPPPTGGRAASTPACAQSEPAAEPEDISISAWVKRRRAARRQGRR